MTRLVVLLFGPAGAGKTTTARESGLTVFDRDDDRWSGERQFTQALGRLALDPVARAVVIRAGATSSARVKSRRLVRATHAFLVLEDQKECIRRVQRRARADKRFGVASVPKWFADFDHLDATPDFPGWDALDLNPTIKREW